MIESVYIGLGGNLASNIGNSQDTLKQAAEHLGQQQDIQLEALSSLYRSQPMGPKDQPDYINAVCHISTSLAPEALLDVCQSIESHFGRERKGERWGPRTLDLDILLFGSQSIKTNRLTIPHVGMNQREFVLVPLFELAPQLVMPDGIPIAKWVAGCSLDGLSRIR